MKQCMVWMHGQHSSAYDLAVLSRAIIHGEPEFYHMYSEKSLTWNGITQQNRNGLLWDKTMNVDGLKTGHTSGAGFNLIASAVDGQRRLIAVVMGLTVQKVVRKRQENYCVGGNKTLLRCKFCTVGKRSERNASGMAIKKISYGNGTRVLDGATESRNSTYQSQIYP